MFYIGILNKDQIEFTKITSGREGDITRFRNGDLSMLGKEEFKILLSMGNIEYLDLVSALSPKGGSSILDFSEFVDCHFNKGTDILVFWHSEFNEIMVHVDGQQMPIHSYLTKGEKVELGIQKFSRGSVKFKSKEAFYEWIDFLMALYDDGAYFTFTIRDGIKDIIKDDYDDLVDYDLIEAGIERAVINYSKEVVTIDGVDDYESHQFEILLPGFYQ